MQGKTAGAQESSQPVTPLQESPSGESFKREEKVTTERCGSLYILTRNWNQPSTSNNRNNYRELLVT